MEDPRPGYPTNPRDIEAIQSLDTARMALRWALERIHAVEKQMAEAESKAKQEARLREAVERRIESTEREWAAKAAEAERRGAFQGKLAQMRIEQKEAALDESRQQLEAHSRSLLSSLQNEAERLRVLLHGQSQEHIAAVEKLVSERLESQRLAWESEKGLLSAERDRLALRVQELEASAATPASEAVRASEEARRRAEEARRETDAARARQAALESQLESAAGEHSKLLAEREAWTRKAQELGAALERSQMLSERVKSLEFELEREKASAAADGERQRLSLRAVEEESQSLRRERDSLRAELELLKSWRAEAAKRLEGWKAWRSDMEKKVLAWRSERQRLVQAIRALQQQLTSS